MRNLLEWRGFIVALCLLNGLALTACQPNGADDAPGDSTSENLIIGGRVAAKKSEVSSTTVGLIDTARGTLCTASLLTKEIAITAAHCVDGRPEDMQLSFGPRASGRETRPVIEAVTSPTWPHHQSEPTDNGDIALVRFSGGLPAGAKEVAVMKASHHLSDGEIVTLAGYGISDPDGEGAGHLRTVDVKIANSHFSRTEVSLDQTEHAGACHGDSGGPAFIQDTNGGLLIWGITSRGINDPSDRCAGQVVYTRILPYAHWINSVVKKWTDPADASD